jgi:hypothetical protein
MMEHRLEHLGRRDRRLSVLQRAEDDPLLDERYGRRTDLDAEVSAGDHHRVGGADDLVQFRERLRLLDLRDDERRRVARVQELPQSPQVVGRAHERERDEVHVEVESKLEVAQVLLGEGGNGNGHPREVDPLVGLHRPADEHAGAGSAAVHLLDPQPHAPVVDQKVVAGPQHLGENGRADRQSPRPVLLAGDLQLVALDEHERALQLPHAELRTLEVRDQRERAPGALLRTSNGLRTLGMILVRSVREVQPGGVHARRDEPVDRACRGRGGPDRADDLRAS